MRTLAGFALGTLLALGAVTAARAAATNAPASAQSAPAGIEIIVVTAKRPAAQPIDAATPVDAAERIEEFIVTAKRVSAAPTRTPPVLLIDVPDVEFAVAEPPVIRL